MKKLSYYADLTNPKQLFIGVNPEIKYITSDSRKVIPGTLFIAKKGVKEDGNKYIPAAIEAGAVAIISSSQDLIPQDFPYILVENTTPLIGVLSSAFYNYPSYEMKIIGITGTNGKTTIATLLYKLFLKLGYRVGLVSTIENKINNETIASSHTTPDPEQLQYLLHRMQQASCQYVFMEVSSHAVSQERIAGIQFSGAVFTNLTRDHLDYHGSFLNYLQAKKKFFDLLPPLAFAVTNIDDKNGLVMVQNTEAKIYTYALQSIADFKTRILAMNINSSEIEIDGKEVEIALVGKYNVYNFLAIYAVAIALGIEKEQALQVASSLQPATGRFQTILLKSGAVAVIDYAHTPDALENILSTLRSLLPKENKLITIVGAGGDRDKGKRPMMASVSEKYSDMLILTSDNPRSEDPKIILDDMLEGVENKRSVKCILDRREAIQQAVREAQLSDLILIAGKGHETYQEIDGIKYHFDDQEELRIADENINKK